MPFDHLVHTVNEPLFYDIWRQDRNRRGTNGTPFYCYSRRVRVKDFGPWYRCERIPDHEYIPVFPILSVQYHKTTRAERFSFLTRTFSQGPFLICPSLKSGICLHCMYDYHSPCMRVFLMFVSFYVCDILPPSWEERLECRNSFRWRVGHFHEVQSSWPEMRCVHPPFEQHFFHISIFLRILHSPMASRFSRTLSWHRQHHALSLS